MNKSSSHQTGHNLLITKIEEWAMLTKNITKRSALTTVAFFNFIVADYNFILVARMVLKSFFIHWATIK
jgi:hypothetical protein